MKAFVAGATGYTGREVVRLAVEAGIEVVAHVRPNSSRLEEWRKRFEAMGATVDSSAWSDEAMGAALLAQKPSMVFALLGTTRARAKEENAAGGSSNYDTIDYGLTAMLMKAAAALEDKPRFVYLSSAGVPEREPAAGSYMHARWRVERELQAGEMPYTIARPSFITGPDRDDARLGERWGAAVADGALSVVGALGGRKWRDRYSSTTNGILAGALVRLAQSDAAANRIVESEGLRAV